MRRSQLGSPENFQYWPVREYPVCKLSLVLEQPQVWAIAARTRSSLQVCERHLDLFALKRNVVTQLKF